MNAFISAFITFAIFVTSLFGSFIAVEAPEDKTEFTPVLRFFAASDSHVESMGDTQALRMQKALKMAYAIADSDKEYNKLDAALFAGDLTDNGRKDQFLGFTVAAKSVLREETELLAVIAKSHDSSTLDKGVHPYFSGVVGEDTDIHKVINGYHFIGLSVSKTEGEHYSEYQREWLDEQLALQQPKTRQSPFSFSSTSILQTPFTAAPILRAGVWTISERCSTSIRRLSISRAIPTIRSMTPVQSGRVSLPQSVRVHSTTQSSLLTMSVPIILRAIVML